MRDELAQAKKETSFYLKKAALTLTLTLTLPLTPDHWP